MRTARQTSRALQAAGALVSTATAPRRAQENYLAVDLCCWLTTWPCRMGWRPSDGPNDAEAHVQRCEAYRVAVVLKHHVAGAVGVDEAGGVDGAAGGIRADEWARSGGGEGACSMTHSELRYDSFGRYFAPPCTCCQLQDCRLWQIVLVAALGDVASLERI